MVVEKDERALLVDAEALPVDVSEVRKRFTTKY
jgi:hypothetical protein